MFRMMKFAVIAVALIFCAACERKPQAPMAFGGSPWPAYESVYLAGELGYLKGVNLHLQDFPDVSAVEQALRGDKIQLAALTLDRALLLRRDIPSLKVILVFASGPGNRMDVLVTRDENIGTYHHEMQLFLQAWHKTVEYMHAHPDQALASMARHEGISPAQFSVKQQGMELYDFLRNQQALIGEPPPISKAVDATQRDLLGSGRLSIGMDTSMLVDSTLIAEPAR